MFAIVLALAAPALAEDAPPLLPVTARVRELGGTEALAGARASVPGVVSATAVSDAQGRLRLSLPAGASQLRLEADDFEPQTQAIQVGPQGADLGTLSLRRVAFQAAVVKVRARRDEAPSRTPIKRAEIRRIAGVGRDPLRALQTLPGVVSPSDFSGQLAVRGGGPQDNAYFLNDVPWPLPFHYGGALSTVHSDLLEDVDLYAAAFPARWGGVDGAILDAHSRAPKRDRLHGQVDVNLLLSEMLLEGPFGDLGGQSRDLSGTAAALSPTAASAPALEPSGGGAWLISGRRSYFDLILPSLGSRFTAVPRFWDLSLLGVVDLGPSDQLRFTGLATDDILGLELKPEDVANTDFQGEFRFHTYFNSFGVNWIHLGDGFKSTLTPYTNYLSLEQSFGKGYGISIRPFTYGIKEDLRWEAGRHEWGWGGGVQGQRYQVFGYTFRRASGNGSGFTTLSDPAGITINAGVTTGNAYLQDRVSLGAGLKLTLGGRWQKADGMGNEAWDPRSALEWQAGPDTRLNAGWGLYSQFPSARELSADFGNPALGFNRTEHSVIGVEQRLDASHSLKVEAYYKTYRDRVVEVPDARLFSNDGEGYARGAELLLKQESGGRFFGWVSYSYAESWRLQKGQDWRRYQYDQPHTLTVLGSYDLGPAWSLGAKVNWHSGPLITPVLGTVADANPANTAGVLPVYGQPYSERLDDYLRLDLRSDYAVRLEGARLNFYAEVLNVLGRDNPAGVTYNRNFTKRETVNNLPLLPYLGFGLEF